ncbi:MAG: hypothetical protein JXR76_06860 [Deltaproteobacteria bacterium]|nr:hypothetical protein [Deltaproteobacteria bacterium]
MLKLLKSKKIVVMFTAFLLLFSLVPAQAESTDDLVVIANKRFSADNLSLTEVKRIFKKEITNFHGTRVKPIHARDGNALRQQFVNKVLGMNPSAEKKYWQEMMVKKGMNPPSELTNTVRGVFSTPGAISYCFRKDFNPTTSKIVLSL